jgi:hypothetical protein
MNKERMKERMNERKKERKKERKRNKQTPAGASRREPKRER